MATAGGGGMSPLEMAEVMRGCLSMVAKSGRTAGSSVKHCVMKSSRRG